MEASLAVPVRLSHAVRIPHHRNYHWDGFAGRCVPMDSRLEAERSLAYRIEASVSAEEKQSC